MKTGALLLSLVFSLSLAACGKDKPEEAPAPQAPVPVAEAPAEPPVADVAGEADRPEASADDLTDRKSGYEIYVAQCISCHGDLGQGVGDNPKLAGLTVADVDARLKAYREGKQVGPKTAVMAPMAKSLSDDEIDALARYIGE